MSDLEHFMRRALDLANLPSRSLLPNPRVGAVIVRKGRIIAEGLHAGPGQKHAEMVALERAYQGLSAKKRKSLAPFSDCQLFVTLEPCCHLNKRTPPCCPAVIQAGFSHVIVAHQDPNPAVSGRGVKALKRAGIKVTTGILQDEALQINQAFIKNQQMGLPYITVKVAMTFDGKLHDDFSKSKWISSEASRIDVHEQRSRAQAIGIGATTLRTDNPRLDSRLTGDKRMPSTVVVFGKLSEKDLGKSRLGRRMPRDQIIMVEMLSKTHLRRLYKDHGIHELFVEAGPRLASQWLRQRLADRLVIYYGRGFLGGPGKGALGQDWGLRRLSQSISFQPQEARLLGSDCKISGTFHVYRPHTNPRNRRIL